MKVVIVKVVKKLIVSITLCFSSYSLAGFCCQNERYRRSICNEALEQMGNVEEGRGECFLTKTAMIGSRGNSLECGGKWGGEGGKGGRLSYS